eukprot:4983155-Pleurochrysis_carterae.AAC.1
MCARNAARKCARDHAEGSARQYVSCLARQDDMTGRASSLCVVKAAPTQSACFLAYVACMRLRAPTQSACMRRMQWRSCLCEHFRVEVDGEASDKDHVRLGDA